VSKAFLRAGVLTEEGHKRETITEHRVDGVSTRHVERTRP
jgi:hypothetical protein